MVRPRDFGFNEETGLDNEFQTGPRRPRPRSTAGQTSSFRTWSIGSGPKGVDVLVLEPDPADPRKLPDAVFPNNWFSTEHDGTIIVYPMKAPNRRANGAPATSRPCCGRTAARSGRSFQIGRVDENEQFLEGTGSLVIDHAARVVYAARSQRCSSSAVPELRPSAVVPGGNPLRHPKLVGQGRFITPTS